MPLTPQTLDMLILTGFKILDILARTAKGEDIKDDDLKLESLEETMAKVKKEVEP